MSRTRIRSTSLALLLAAGLTAGLTAGLGVGAVPAQAAPPPTPAPATDGWRVVGTGATWTSPTRLPVTSARPEVLLRGGPVGSSLSADGRSVTAVVPVGTRPDDLDVVLSGVPLDEPDARPAPGAARPDGLSRLAPVGPDLGVDPGRRGPHAVQSSDYALAPLTFAGFDVPLEVTGHVVAPAAAEQVTGRPLVLLLHGRHQYCYDPRDPDAFGDAWPCAAGERPVPSDLGYDYLQRLLASQGYTTVSISANGVNAQDFDAADGGALARSALVRRHLDAWAAGEVEAAPGVDLDRVVLVGHSRGGEGVDLAAQEVPLGAPYRIAGQVLVGPVDFARRTAAYVPTVTLLPYCDGDVSDLQGQLYTDTSRGLAPGDTALKSTVLVMGANHNYFNTEWTPGAAQAPAQDDWGLDDGTCGAAAASRLRPAQQRAVGAAYVAGAVQLFTGDDPATLAMYDGTPGHVASAGSATVYSHAVGGGRSLVLPETVTPSGTGTAVARTCAGVAGGSLRTACGRGVDPSRAPHWAPPDPEGLPTRSAVEVAWTRAGAVGRLGLAQPWDLSGDASLDLRVVAAPWAGSAAVDVRLEDATGASVTLRPSNGGEVRALPGRAPFGLARLVAQQLRVPLDQGSGIGGVDLTRVTAVSLVARSSTGTVWVLDLAGAPATLPTVPHRRLPVISLGDAEVVEQGAGRQVADVPWTLSAPLDEPGRLFVLTQDADGGLGSRVVEVPAGRRSGSFGITYTADDAWTPPRSGRVDVVPVSGVAVADGTGAVTVVDDEPAPTATVSVPTPVREGSAVRVTVRLDRPVGVEVGVALEVLRPPTGPRLGTADLPPRWVARHVYALERRAPLWRSYVDLYGVVPAGRTTTTLVVPTRTDRLREGGEHLLLDVLLPDLGTSTRAGVVVRDR